MSTITPQESADPAFWHASYSKKLAECDKWRKDYWELFREIQRISVLLSAIKDTIIEDGDLTSFGSTNDADALVAMAHELESKYFAGKPK